LRLLLDEHYSPRIAEQLRARGHDVVAVKEREDLIGRSDRELFDAMATEGRAIVTENWADFRRLLDEAAASRTSHWGVVFTSRARLPRSEGTIGLFVRVLDEFLSHRPADVALSGTYCWLPEAPTEPS
jgi:hypothetical protein